ncbi:NAD(P)-binding protein [Cryphonectria parasitica EP155]|uniref:NAD(P)-binding protein n=1 Tax=Cryphonectria parasitica (strain ATCC 38755 / EP155) TaxID=660469 RepID=A0A9P5CME1_CRYP1|nr:NAD(P)-binding protein [Cryphonectria parasitica EP155]KAF3764013.1 NAD(P)-binding protein [Cryphonectria parasitica EP155]
MAPQTWFITGCSSGFGAEFVHQLRALGDNVIASGRDAKTKLAHLKDTGASILDLDVTSSEDVIASKLAEAWEIYPGGIDVVINNAGYILSAPFEELTQKDLEVVFNTNFHGPLNITRALLPKMRAKGKGTLLFMSSQAGWHADPSATGYCATKFALEGAVECLSKELAIFAPGLKVLLIEPGYFRTRAFSNISHIDPRIDDYAEFNLGVKAFEQSLVGNEPGDSTKAVQRMIEIVKGTGMATGKQIPLRIPLGSDGWSRIKAVCEETLKICEDWEDVAKSTDAK